MPHIRRSDEEARALFGDGGASGFVCSWGAGCSRASADQDGFMVEHGDEYDVGASASAGCGGEDASNGEIGTRFYSENDCDAGVRDPG